MHSLFSRVKNQIGGAIIETGLIVALVAVAAIPAVKYMGINTGDTNCKLAGSYDPDYLRAYGPQRLYIINGEYACRPELFCQGVQPGEKCSGVR